MYPWAVASIVALALFLAASGAARAAEIVVNTELDQNGGNPAQCSLREAILAAILNAVTDGCPAGEAAPAVDVIKFSIGSGIKTITIDTSQLDEILEPVIIDATTQPGYAGSPLIELRRGTAPYGTHALRVRGNGSGSTIKGLAISNWSQRTAAAENPGRGIRVDGANNVTIQGNWFGLRADGSQGGGNATDLTIINGAQNTQVGGASAAARNVFSGNSPFVNGDSISVSGATTTGTKIQGNYFGISPDGTTKSDGASITFSSGASNILIGGNSPGERNVIGVSIVDFSSAAGPHQFIGNHIGVNVNGATLGNNPTVSIGGVGTVVKGNVATTLTVGGSNTIIQGNLVGLGPDGATVIGGGGLTVSSTGSTVGGTTATERNVVAGSSGHGLTLAGSNLVVKGNYIGTDLTGLLARPNANGVSLSAIGTVFGGAAAGEGNVISGNTGYGVRITGNGQVLAGNLIGVGANGTTALGNGSHGIVFNSNDSNPVTIGGTTTGTGNTIANNGGAGIRNDFASRLRVSMLGNSIFANATLGVMLGFGPSPRANDANDADSGPNGGQNYPILTAATPATGTAITGTLNSTPSTTGYRIELFGSPTCDASGNGEGRMFLGSTTLNTDASGNGAFSTTVSSTLTAGTQVTATATDPQGNTSEFSACFAVAGGATPPPPAPTCSPRPPVVISTSRGAAGTLVVTVRAGEGAISRIDFGAPRAIANASVSVSGGQTNQTQAFTFTPTNSPTSVQFTVTSANRTLATTVPFTVIDGCGSWTSFAGGGAGSF